MLPLVATLGAMWFSAPPKAPERRIALQTFIGAILVLIPCRFQLYHLMHLLEDALPRFPRADVRQASAATPMARP
jgi:hypothetical protein